MRVERKGKFKAKWRAAEEEAARMEVERQTTTTKLDR